MNVHDSPMVSAADEWSPLRAVIVGRAEHSIFPSEAPHMMKATIDKRHLHQFKPNNPFPPELLEEAQKELDNLAATLEKHGVKVYRPKEVDWLKVGGYTGAMPRDALMTVGNTLIESAFSWRCRFQEVDLAYSDILDQIRKAGGNARICRAPVVIGEDTIYEGVVQNGATDHTGWAINNTRPCFDTADFMRFGNTIIGQVSNVTNLKGIDYLRSVVPEGYHVEVLYTTEGLTTRHIDATILPLRKGLLVYCPARVSEESLREHAVFQDWELVPFPFQPKPHDPNAPPNYMCSPWIVLNVLSIDERKVLVEENNVEFADWLKEKFDMEPIMLPFRHVNSIGGSFHCATTDLVRG